MSRPASARRSLAQRREPDIASVCLGSESSVEHVPGGRGEVAVPSSRGITARCNEFGRRRNDQQMFVLICKILITLRSKAMAQQRKALGDAGFRSIETGGERTRKRKQSGRQGIMSRPLTGMHKNAEASCPGKESKQGGYRNVATERNACRFAAGAVGASPGGRRRKREVVDDLWRRHSEY